jgi:hypothetical protein
MELQDFKAVTVKTATKLLDRKYKIIKKKGLTV